VILRIVLLVLELVGLDVAAARAAAVACTDAALALRQQAAQLEGAARGDLAAWTGQARLAFDGAANDLAAGLRAEAVRLEHTADRIERAIVAARAEDARRVAERAAARAVVP